MSGIFNAQIWNNAIFNTGESGVVEIVVKTGTGGIDPEKKRRRTIYKPTGLIDRPQSIVEQRVLESKEIQREVFAEVIGPILREQVDLKPIQEMTSAEIDKEIGILMREKVEEEDDMMMVMMMIAND